MKEKYKKIILYTLSFFLLLLFTIFNMSLVAKVESKTDSVYRELRKLSETLKIIKNNYVEETEEEKILEGALKGMLMNLDPFSAYLSQKEFREMQIETQGEYGGLGIEITIHNGVLTVVSPIEDTPAFRAGLKPGDIILKINDRPTKDLSLSEAVELMRGPPKTKVILTIVREGKDKPFEVEIVRDIIKVKAVKSLKIEDGILYLSIKQFQTKTSEEVISALRSAGFTESSPLEFSERGVILDLRNNPGGLLDEAIKVSDVFLSSGTIVFTKNREGVKNLSEARDDGFENNFQLIVLVNRGSASASEIVAGALKDNNRALIIGERTFGKASVQTIFPLEGGDGIRLTTAYYYTPSGALIHNKGIDPHIEFSPQTEPENFEEKISKSFEERVRGDPMVQKAVELLKAWKIFGKLQTQNQSKR